MTTTTAPAKKAASTARAASGWQLAGGPPEHPGAAIFGAARAPGAPSLASPVPRVESPCMGTKLLKALVVHGASWYWHCSSTNRDYILAIAF